MISISLKEQVQKAVAGEWNGFAARHPRLAEVVDQTLLMEQATACLADDPEFRGAMEEAAATGRTAEVVVGLIERFVKDWLKKLI